MLASQDSFNNHELSKYRSGELRSPICRERLFPQTKAVNYRELKNKSRHQGDRAAVLGRWFPSFSFTFPSPEATSIASDKQGQSNVNSKDSVRMLCSQQS
jgi:hypothetical protein